MSQDNKRITKIVLLLTGAAFLIAGIFGLTSPAFFEQHSGMGPDEIRYMCITFVLIGVVDIAMAKFVFGGAERK